MSKPRAVKLRRRAAYVLQVPPEHLGGTCMGEGDVGFAGEFLYTDPHAPPKHPAPAIVGRSSTQHDSTQRSHRSPALTPGCRKPVVTHTMGNTLGTCMSSGLPKRTKQRTVGPCSSDPASSRFVGVFFPMHRPTLFLDQLGSFLRWMPQHCCSHPCPARQEAFEQTSHLLRAQGRLSSNKYGGSKL